ncbi:MAG: beta-ketoacyl-ACP synthase II [Salinisphaeraceae bacterium]|nr:beta-ketoacyl-ACP synthase II [Salinisphaeraceae bacterium]
MSKRRVVITGLGLISPLGNNVKDSWDGILAGKSGIDNIQSFDCSAYPTRFAGEIRNFDPATVLGPKDIKKTDAFIHYGAAATAEALADSGFEITEDNAERVGVSIGSGIGGIGTIHEQDGILHEKGNPKRISPFFVPSSIINMVSGYMSILHGTKGPNIAVVTACTTGTHSIGMAARMIAYGDADVMLAGGAEMATNPLGLAGFCASRALSTRNDDPQAASRPWDKDRDGFVLSDGAGVMVLEDYEHAKARGAEIYAEIVGFGMSGDAYHITLPAEGGDGGRRCMLNAINDAGINPEDVQYINAHGTSTPAGDVAETTGIKNAFGDHAYKLAVSSTKSMTGHLLGAAGACEAILSVLAIRDQIAPPTINLENPSEDCDLDYVPHTAREMPIEHALSNSFGFGGTNGSLLFKRI